MREWFLEFAIVIGAPLIMLFTTRVPQAWTFVNHAAYETGECYDHRTQNALLAAHKGNISGMRALVLQRANRHVDPDRREWVTGFVRRLWLDAILSDREVIGAFCQLGLKYGALGHNLPDLARIFGIANIVTTPAPQLAALAAVYAQHMRAPLARVRLIEMYRAHLATGGG